MKRFIKSAIIALGLTLLSVGSGVTWYALSSPAVEDLPLSPELIAISSPEGQRLLVTSESKEDFSQLSPHMVGQIRRAFCGPATAAALVNAGLRPQPPVTQAMLFNPAATAVKGELALSFGGLTLAELAAFLGAHGLQAERVHASDSDLDTFRGIARATLGEARRFLVVNYDRKVLKQQGAGHISPVGAYDSTTDRLLVMDVATRKYPYTWVPVALMWSAMDTTDPDSGKKRGYLIVSAP